MTALIEGRHLVKTFPAGRGWLTRKRVLHAVDDVSLELASGETVALVGESGSGKSTIGRLLLALLEPSAGEIRYRGYAVEGMTPSRRRDFRREVQVVFQDAGASLNPRRSIGASIEVPLRYNLGLAPGVARERANALLDTVGLAPGVFRDRLPHELSGGQRQRVGIARAIACNPRVIVADEPVSALDVSVRAQILSLMRRLQGERAIASLFITHDLGVVRAIADRVIVLYLGAVMEEGAVDAILTRPLHPYTRSLLAATPVPDPAMRERARPKLVGEIPSPLNKPSGCRFHTRCPHAIDRCRAEAPVLEKRCEVKVACHRADELMTAGGL